MRLPGRGRSVSARNSVKSSFHHRSRRSFSVADVNPSIGAIMASSIRDSQLAGNDRAGTRKHAEARQIPDKRENADKGAELHHVGDGVLRQNFPEEPQDRLSDRDGPHRAVEIPPLMTLAFR